ncbi:MAG TPA: anti-sigma factor [Bryobacteraceae bacterium]|nr:anti-sigma factor [Bryobacteraceae bacterium]
MNCHELREHYELFALGAAEDPERSEIRAHLDRECEVCMAGVKRAIELATVLSGTAPAVEPARNLRRRILMSAGVEERRFSWTPLWALAAALSLAVAIYFGIEERRDAQETRRLRNELANQSNEVTRLAEAFAILNGPDTRETSFGNAQPRPPRGKVFLNPTQGVLLIASNLPPAPLGKLYEMWVIPRAGRPVPAGMFQSQSDGSAMHVRRGAVDIASTGVIAVTVENEAGADQPTTTPVIAAPVGD